MFGRKLKLFKLFGFEISIDTSWFLLAFLIVWTLSAGYFPILVPGLPLAKYWAMGLAGAVGLFLSIVLHETCHSLIARRYGLPMKGITLFMFGGIAEMGEESKDPKTELLMAAAGPLCSFVLALLFWGLYRLGDGLQGLPTVFGIVFYLSRINLFLALFNLIPAFPLDGGRIFRALLWFARKDLKQATRTASRVGAGFGIVFIGVAFLNLLYGNFIGALWIGLIGLFLRSISQLSYRQVVIRQTLAGEPVSRFMSPNPIVAPPTLTLEQLVQNFIYKFHHKMFPVMDRERLLGCVGTRQLKQTPREEWSQKTVGEVLEPCSPDNVIPPNADAARALSQMNRTNKSRLLVAENGNLRGILSLKDILQFLSLKLELESEEGVSDFHLRREFPPDKHPPI